MGRGSGSSPQISKSVDVAVAFEYHHRGSSRAFDGEPEIGVTMKRRHNVQKLSLSGEFVARIRRFIYMEEHVDLAVRTAVNAVRILSGQPASEKQEFEIRRFIAQGMPSEEVVDALHRAYTNSTVQDSWRYFCGICWRVISRTKRGSVGETVSSRGRFPWS